MTRHRTAKAAPRGSARGGRPWLLLLGLLVVPAAALAVREYPALVRYIKIERM
jgi:hypothetical protein